jgi:hypothetical protein
MTRSTRLALLSVAVVVVIAAVVLLGGGGASDTKGSGPATVVAKAVEAGGSAHFKFPAKIDGKFIVELEDHEQTLANVTVEP